jgi:hypothetical protein
VESRLCTASCADSEIPELYDADWMPGVANKRLEETKKEEFSGFM